jgi:hypothetical protein
MKTYSSAITNYRAAQREFWQIVFLSIKVRDRSTGDSEWFHFSSRDENETVQVRDPQTGSLEYRDYIGGGCIVGMDQLVRSEGTGVRNFSVTLSAVSDDVQDMIQGYDCRDAVVEVHVGEGEDSTGLMVDTPVCEFEGFVDTVDRQDGAAPVEATEPAPSVFVVSMTSHIATLLRINPDMRSHEVGEERGGDDIFIHSDAANQWDIMWGKRGHRHKDGDGGDGKDKRSGDDPNIWGRR